MLTRSSVLAVALALLFVGCGPQAVNTVPTTARVAHYGTEVLTAVTAVQTYVNTTAAAVPAFVPVGRQITDANQKLHDAATQLAAALKAYDAASTLDAKNLSRVDIETTLAAFNATLGDVFHVQVPSEVGGQLYALYANVSKLIADVQAELARGWVN